MTGARGIWCRRAPLPPPEGPRQRRPIGLRAPLRTRGWSLAALLGLALGWLLLGTGAAPALALPSGSALQERQALWPAWSLPAPLRRPGRQDLELPDWMLGSWDLLERDPGETPAGESTGVAAPDPVDAAAERSTTDTGIRVRFLRNRRGQVVGDRAFNALSVGRSVLGDSLLAVESDPQNPNRQLARLRGDRLLESTVIGRASLTMEGDTVLADELTLQILHGPGRPQVSQVEVLARYSRLEDGVSIEQWQTSYAAPGEGGTARRSSHRLLLLRQAPESIN